MSPTLHSPDVTLKYVKVHRGTYAKVENCKGMPWVVLFSPIEILTYPCALRSFFPSLPSLSRMSNKYYQKPESFINMLRYFQAAIAERFCSSDSLLLLSIWTIHIYCIYIYISSPDIRVVYDTYVESSFARAIKSTPSPSVILKRKKKWRKRFVLPGFVFTREYRSTASFPQINICSFLHVYM